MNFKIQEGDSVTEAGTIPAKGANAIVFVNVGSDVAYVGNRPIPVYAAGMQEYPSITYCGLEGEKMLDGLSVRFATAVAPRVLVIRKYYATQGV